MKINIAQTPNFQERRNQGYLSYPSRIAYAIYKRGVTVKFSDRYWWESAVKNENFKPDPDGEVIHFRTGFNRKIHEELYNRGFICVNSPEAVYNSNDKLHSQLLANNNNIPIAPTHPEVLRGDSTNFFDQLAHVMDSNDWSSCVIKPNFSSGNGSNVWKLDRDEVYDFDIRRIRRVPYWTVQKCIKYNRIIRCILHGGKLINECITYDQPLPGGWKCTVCINPNLLQEKNPTSDLAPFVENICRVIKADDPGIAYIDIFDTDDGYVYGETNINCTLELHERVTGFPIHQHKADYLINLLKNR
jgi:glutathione synthase/RimK-type ligase-like ATP-grasp enzyme